MDIEVNYDEEYNNQRLDLLNEIQKTNILGSLGILDIEERKNKISDIRKQILDLDIAKLKSIRDNLIEKGKIDKTTLTDEDFSKFENIDERMRGRMIENIIEFSNDDIKSSLIKLYDSLTIYNLDDTLNRIFKVHLIKFIENDKQIKEQSQTIISLNEKLRDANDKNAALELALSLNDMSTDIKKSGILGKRSRSDSSDSSDRDRKRSDIRENYQDDLAEDNSLNAAFVVLLCSYGII